MLGVFVKVVLLAGGQGTRIREESEYRPKPMVEIGGRPIIWHIMKTFSYYGHNDFIICVGYKGYMIKDYFLNFYNWTADIQIDFSSNKASHIFQSSQIEKNWNVTLVETGEFTQTGGRVHAIKKYIGEEPFFVTYGDGLSDIDLSKLEKFHKEHGRLATVTAVKPLSRFGVMDIDDKNLVSKFREKPLMEDWVNGGYFIFQPEIFNYLSSNSILEKEPVISLASISELMAYQHNSFWQPMDTYRELKLLQELWNQGNAPWKVWGE